VKLRNYACLTKGDMIAVEYVNKTYEIHVQDLKPANACSIIECDMNVEFEAPVGYKEPQRQDVKPKGDTTPPPESLQQDTGFKPFTGEGMRIDGKKKAVAVNAKDAAEQQKTVAGGKVTNEPIRRGIPNYDYKPGSLTFNRAAKPKQTAPEQEAEKFLPFGGQGQKIRERK